MKSVHDLLFPDPVRYLPHTRAWNIALRTIHIAVTGILLGGHVFYVSSEEQLQLILYLCIFTGVGLVALEAYPSCRWFVQGQGLLVLAKLGLLCLIPWLWDYRVYLLLTVVAMAAVGAHMPSRFRYYSVLHRRILEVPRGHPGWQSSSPKIAEGSTISPRDKVTNPHTARPFRPPVPPSGVSPFRQETASTAVSHRKRTNSDAIEHCSVTVARGLPLPRIHGSGFPCGCFAGDLP